MVSRAAFNRRRYFDRDATPEGAAAAGAAGTIGAEELAPRQTPPAQLVEPPATIQQSRLA